MALNVHVTHGVFSTMFGVPDPYGILLAIWIDPDPAW